MCRCGAARKGGLVHPLRSLRVLACSQFGAVRILKVEIGPLQSLRAMNRCRSGANIESERSAGFGCVEPSLAVGSLWM